MPPKYAICTIMSCIGDTSFLLLLVIFNAGLPTAYICWVIVVATKQQQVTWHRTPFFEYVQSTSCLMVFIWKKLWWKKKITFDLKYINFTLLDRSVWLVITKIHWFGLLIISVFSLTHQEQHISKYSILQLSLSSQWFSFVLFFRIIDNIQIKFCFIYGNAFLATPLVFIQSI